MIKTAKLELLLDSLTGFDAGKASCNDQEEYDGF